MFKELIFNRLTDEQRSFVEDFDNSILVSASAGTGKTTTMIRKILHLLLIEKVDITNLLVVTYTTAAASKMKHDLLVGLEKALEYVEDDSEIIDHINRQMDLLNNADIGTIHAFCNKIIKKYFFELGIDPNYSILSNEKSKSYLINNAINEVFEKNNKDNFEDFFRLYENFNTDRSDTKLRQCILTLYEYLICRIDSDKWLKDSLNDCYIEDNSNKVWQYILQFYKDKWIDLRNKISQCYDYASEVSHDKAMAFGVCRIDYADKILRCKNCLDVASLVSYEKVPNKPKIDTTKDPTLFDLADMVEEYAEAFKTLKKETENVFGMFSKEDFSDNNSFNKANAEMMYKLCKELKESYDNIKKDNNLLDFNDLEHYALKLCNSPQVVEELKEEYKYIFVDEYQDVNYIQDSLISSIAKSNNLYMIGDVKQSIYRFRQSSPEIFLAKYNDYKLGVGDKKLILFNKNFRSDSNILGFVNNIFDHAITKECVGVDYVNEARLISGLGGNEELNHSVHISLLDSMEIKESNASIVDEDVDEVSKREYEAKLIATKVAEIIDRGYSFKDIAILLRDKKELTRNVWITLKQYNIPVTVIIKGNIFKSNEVIILHSWLKLIYNEADDIAFATMLKSPIIGCSDNDLAEIRISAPDAPTYYEACLIAEVSNPVVGAKVTKLRQMLRDFRLNCLNRNVGDLLRSFVIDNYLDVYYKSMPDGIEKECYINEFLNIVDGQLYENDLGRLLDYIEVIKEKETEITISSGNDSVSLMTMHSSKGLDYPVVIVGGFGDNILKNGSYDININKDFGLAVTGVNEDANSRVDNINALAIRLKNRKEEFEESIRLMYVALTRPKKELYITGVINLGEVKKVPLWQCQNYFDIFLLGVSNTNINYFANKKERFCFKENNSYIEGETLSITSLGGGVEASQIILDVSNPNIVTAIRDYHSKERIDYSHIAFKNSVTSILREKEVDYTNTLTKFRKMEVKESMDSETAMELGTQYHTIMQYIDYMDDNQDIKKLIDNLVFAGEVNPIYLSKIDISKIAKAKSVVKALIQGKGVAKKEENFLTLAPHKLLIDDSDCNEEVLVQGVVDLSIDNPDGCIIIDFKTNKTTNKQYLIDSYETQLNLYAKAYEMAYDKKVKHKYLYSFEIEDLIEIK